MVFKKHVFVGNKDFNQSINHSHLNLAGLPLKKYPFVEKSGKIFLMYDIKKGL